uniref:UDP-N-acetylglucosamine 4-epimerase n=1 Tax=Ornithorhynchus anatinus TaxID=9258 RepID=A0A6I8NHU3_ORNAN
MAEEKVLVTGGAGYIGSHTVLELLEAGYVPVVVDNFHNAIRGAGGVPESLRRVEEVTGRTVEFEEVDVLDGAALRGLFEKHDFAAVIHFAGLKAVGESVQRPLDYYRVNLTGTIQLLEVTEGPGEGAEVGSGRRGRTGGGGGRPSGGSGGEPGRKRKGRGSGRNRAQAPARPAPPAPAGHGRPEGREEGREAGRERLPGLPGVTLRPDSGPAPRPPPPQTMQAHGVRKLVFSSSATVYGTPRYLPLDEGHPVGGCTNPYGKSKFFIEEMVRDLCRAEEGWNAVLLRYFNPTGAHPSGRLGEDPQGVPNNLMPYVSQVAVGRREVLSVFGDDYATEDGTGVRDYIHVVDLARGHIAALGKLKENCGCKVYNLGTGTGYSVLQMVEAMERASGKTIPYRVVARRDGDVAVCYADPKLAEEELGWKAAFGLDEMCEDLWRWQKNNPHGFGAAA